MKDWLKAFLIAIAITLVGVLVFIYSRSRNELSITKNENEMLINTLSLGEYASPIIELTIQNQKDEIVAYFKAKSDKSMMHSISIIEGTNDFRDMYLDSYEIQPQQPHFHIDEEYTVLATWPNQKASATFTLKQKHLTSR